MKVVADGWVASPRFGSDSDLGTCLPVLCLLSSVIRLSLLMEYGFLDFLDGAEGGGIISLSLLNEPFLLLRSGEDSALCLGEDVGVDFGVVLFTSSWDPQLERRIIACWSPADDACIREVIARDRLLLRPDELRVNPPSELLESRPLELSLLETSNFKPNPVYQASVYQRSSEKINKEKVSHRKSK